MFKPDRVKDARLSKQLHAETFLSGTWLLVIATASIILGLAGFILHAEMEQNQEQTPLSASLNDLPMLKANLTAKKQVVAPTAPNGVISASDFALCNAALPPSELSNLAGNTSDDALAGKECLENEAVSIAAAIRAVGYTFEATIPRPYIFPGFLQQVLWMLDARHITPALKHLQEAAPAGKLGTLVKIFAWGLPVPLEDLETALGSRGMAAMSKCQLLAPCTKLPGMITSGAMLFPVPNTTLLMTTDWASKSKIGMKEQVVPIVSPESMALTYNSPSPKGLRVLDLDSGTGVHGMVAARRGAASTTLFFRSVRGMRFGQFSVWLNYLGHKVSVLQGNVASQDLQESFQASLAVWNQVTSNPKIVDFDLVLAEPAFLPVPDEAAAVMPPRNGGKDGTKALNEVIIVANKFLKKDGRLALVSDFADPFELGCGHSVVPNFQGGFVLKEKRLSIDEFVESHRLLMPIAGQVANMRMHMNAVKSGFFFGKKNMDGLYDDGCGKVSHSRTLADPYAQPAPGGANADRACFVSEGSDCPEL